jgi:hypothetical protein
MISKFAQTITLDELIKTLKHLVSIDDPDVTQRETYRMSSLCQNPDHAMKLIQISKSCNFKDPKRGGKAKDPVTGAEYPNTSELLQDFISTLEKTNNMNQRSGSTSFNMASFAQKGEDDKKKKKRGNPFRVLMGQVGKLLNHGLEKRDIVRTLTKKGMFDEKMIAKAVDIVKEYNKKKHRKKSTAQTLPNTAEEWPTMDTDYSKRSTAELVTSLCWLNSLDKINLKKHSFDHSKVEDRTGVKTKIRKIKSVLTERGMSADEINKLVK